MLRCQAHCVARKSREAIGEHPVDHCNQLALSCTIPASGLDAHDDSYDEATRGVAVLATTTTAPSRADGSVVDDARMSIASTTTNARLFS